MSTAAIVDLHDRATRFLRDDRSRLLHVVAPAPLCKAATKTILALEASAYARGPFVPIDIPHALGDPGWAARTEALREHYELRRQSGLPRGEAWPELGPAPKAAGLAGFAEQLGAVVMSTPGGAPWVVVLNPSHVKAPPLWARAIAMLLRGSALGRVRWVVIDAERSSLSEGVAEELEKTTIKLTADGPPEGPSLSSFADPEGPSLGAKPDGVVPPRRPGQLPPGPPDPEAIKRKQLAGMIALASEAQREGKLAQAVEHQRRARDLCGAAGWADQQVTMETLLGGYLVAAGSPDQAEQSMRRAVEGAARVPDRPELLPISQLSLGSTLMAKGDRPAGMVSYSEAAMSAEKSGQPALQLEACRLTGDAAILLGMESQAIAFWVRAVELAERDPRLAVLGSASYSARAMAGLCEKRGLEPAARRYWEAAHRFDGLEIPANEPRPTVEVELPEVAAVAARHAPKPEVPAEPEPPAVDEVAPEIAAADVTPRDMTISTLAAWDDAPPEAAPEPAPQAMPPAASTPSYEPPEAVPGPAMFVPGETPPPELELLPEPSAVDGPPELPAMLGGVPPAAAARTIGTIIFGDVTDPAALQGAAERTAHMPVEELEALHWRGAAIDMPSAVVHEWSDDEQAAIREATRTVMGPDATSLMTPEELAALRGEVALPPAREPTPEATAIVEQARARVLLQATEPEADGTAWISADHLESIRGRLGRPVTFGGPPTPAAPVVRKQVVPRSPPADAPPPTAPRVQEDTAVSMTPAQLAELLRKHQQKNEPG